MSVVKPATDQDQSISTGRRYPEMGRAESANFETDCCHQGYVQPSSRPISVPTVIPGVIFYRLMKRITVSCLTTRFRHYFRKVCIMLMARSSMKSMSMAPLSRVKCLIQASSTAIVTMYTVWSVTRKAMTSACSAIRRKSTTVPIIIFISSLTRENRVRRLALRKMSYARENPTW